MKNLRLLVTITAYLVLAICVYTFLLGNDVFKGKFENDGFSWYFLAKGIFCAMALYLLRLVLESIQAKK